MITLLQRITIISVICIFSGCIPFKESDLDPNSSLSKLLLLCLINKSNLIDEPILTRSLSGYANGTKAFFSWNKVPNANSYKVYYSKSNNVTVGNASSPETTNPWILIEGLEPSTMYYFRVVAQMSNGRRHTQKTAYPAFTNPTPLGTASTVTAVNISLGNGADSGINTDIRVNPYRNMFYVAAQFTNTPGARAPSNYSANSDGSNPVYRNLSNGNSTSGNDFLVPNIVLDFENNKFIQSANSFTLGEKPVQFHCNFEETTCSYQDVSVGQANLSGATPFGVLDPYTGNSITITRNRTASVNTLSMFNCDNDGANCKFTNLSSFGQGAETGYDAHATIDPYDAKLLIAVRNNSPSATALNTAYLFRCEIDGSACSFTDISAGQVANTATAPFITIDHINSKILTFTQNASAFGTLSLYRCDLSGLNCVHYDISSLAGLGGNSGNSPSAILDPINNKMLIHTQNANTSGLSLFRCDLDVTNCTHTNLSSLYTTTIDIAGITPSSALDPVSGKTIIASHNNIPLVNGLPFAFIH